MKKKNNEDLNLNVEEIINDFDNKRNESKLKKNSTQVWIKKIVFIIFLIFLMMLFVTYTGYGATQTQSVVSEEASAGKFMIDCLGDNNLLYIYAYDESEPQGRLSYQSQCDISKSVKEQLIYDAQKLMIKSDPDETEDLINYVEHFDTISNDKLAIKMDTFTDKVCFTINLNRFANVKIAGDLEQQVKDYYKCFDKETLTQDTQRGEDTSIVEVYIDDELRQEFVIKKPKKDLRISFTDLAFINDDLKDKIDVKITNPASNELKVRVIDTNLNCHTKSFVMSSEYKLLCNKTKNMNSYYIQLQDSSKDIYYGEYQIPPENKSDSGINNIWFIVLAIGIVLFALYTSYKNKVQNREKKAVDELDEDDE